MKHFNFAEIKERGSCIDFVEQVLGETVTGNRCAATWRNGERDSVRVERDRWFDHVTEEGGGLVELCARSKFGGLGATEIQQAQEWLGEWLHLDEVKLQKKTASAGKNRHDELIAEGYVEKARYEYRDLDGKLVYAEYDVWGNKLKLTAIDIDGNPIRFASEGWASCCSKYDARGNEIEKSVYDENGMPCMNNLGYHKIIGVFDELGHVLEASYYDTIGYLCINYNGFACYKNKYDDRYRKIESSYYGTKGEPINADGFHKEVFILDKYGDVVETSFYDNEMNLLNKNVYAPVIMIVDMFTPASYEKVPIGSLVIQCNDWILGMSEASNRMMRKKCYYSSSKDYFYLTPDNKIGYFHLDKGQTGMGFQDYLIEKEYAEKLVQRLNEWKADSLSYYYPQVNP